MTPEPKTISIFGDLKVVEQFGDMELLSDGQVLIDGYAVPYIHVEKFTGENGFINYAISLDQRFAYNVPTLERLLSAVSLAANSMAIAKGYSSFGANLRPMNEFNFRPLGFRDLLKG